jgi:hypothetical protein
LETADGNASGHFGEAMFADQLVQNVLQRNPVEGIVRMRNRFGHMSRDNGFDFTLPNYHEFIGFVQREEKA